jgi:hypothetical protein
VGFVVLCHDAGVLPSVALFRHFFSLFRRDWYCFLSMKAAGALFAGVGLKVPKSQRGWKRVFFLPNLAGAMAVPSALGRAAVHDLCRRPGAIDPG